MTRRLLLLLALPLWVGCGSSALSDGDGGPDASSDVQEVDDLVQTDIAFTCKQGATEPCGSGEGRCEPGTRTCVDGLWGPCQGGVSASPEACNGQDDDCDGLTDEEYTISATSCGTGACEALGTLSCAEGAELDSCVPGQPAGDDTTCDGVDDDCDGVTDEAYPAPTTACGTGACATTGQLVCDGGQTHDTCAAGTGAADDATCDGVDDDCDGATDEDFAPGVVTCGVGACLATGTTACVDGVVVDSCSPGGAEGSDPICNGLDDDCDGLTDDDYISALTTCGVGACASSGQLDCVAGQPVDSCVPSLPATDDATCDGLDDDCDGQADEDATPAATTCGTGACAATGALVCEAGVPRDTCKAGSGAASDPTCDGVDDDCDGAPDDDYQPLQVTCGVGACLAQGTTVCLAGDVVVSCSPGGAAGSDPVCNGLDDDCDGVTDDDYVPPPTTCGVGACAAAGELACVQGAQVDTCSPGAPAASDATCDGQDDDCNGIIDEDFVGGQTSCGLGACSATGTSTCVGGQVVATCTPGQPLADDDGTCDGVDDDCDGAADDDYVPAPTACGVGACLAQGELACVAGAEVDPCTPGQPAPHDATCDAIDDDCDGLVDDDYAPVPTTCGVGACARSGQIVCDAGATHDNCAAGQPAADDATCDAIDDDCDGLADDDYAARATTCGTGACAATGVTSCMAGAELDSCVPGPAGLEVCNGVDDDCNGKTDAADTANLTGSLFTHDQPACEKTAGVCATAKKTVAFCKNGAWLPCNDTIYTYWDAAYQATEGPTCDGKDNDCDASTDEAYVPSPTSCGTGACAATGQKTCVAGAEVDSCVPGSPTAEVCNGLDDSCDGQVDEGGDATCSLELERPAACVDGTCRVTCSLPSDCLWIDWLVDCTGSWACTQGLCRPQCGGGCGNGVCEPAKGEDAWTCPGDCKACTKNADCGTGQLCEFGQGACQAPGSCLNAPLTCPLTWAPVCGCDGVTYGNACLRRAAGVAELHTGECKVATCETAADCLGNEWQVKCYGHWTCVDKACAPECGAPCGDGTCDPTKGEDAATCAPDCVPPKPTAFRADAITLVSPTLCLAAGGGTCVDVTPLANQMIAEQLASSTEPLDLLYVFTPLDLASTTAAFDLQDGTCQRDAAGAIVLCGPTSGATPNVFASPFFGTDGACVSSPSTIAAPCFSSTSEDARFRLLGVLFGLFDPLVAGSFQFDSTSTATGLTPGLITGFLPQSLASKLQFDVGLGVPITLADLLSHVPIVVHEGNAGWWVTFSYSAVPVPYAP